MSRKAHQEARPVGWPVEWTFAGPADAELGSLFEVSWWCAWQRYRNLVASGLCSRWGPELTAVASKAESQALHLAGWNVHSH